MRKVVQLWIVLICSTCSARMIKIGVIADPHVGGYNDKPPNYYAKALDKLPTAMADFNAMNVDVMIECGDFVNTTDDLNDTNHNDIYDLLDIWIDDVNYPSLADVNRLYVIGNHDFSSGGGIPKSKFIEIVGQDSNPFFNAGNDDCTYGYYDIGDLRLFILDDGYDRYGNDLSSTKTYFSDEELGWLDTQLAIADAAGKFSLCFHHHSIMNSYLLGAYIQNEDAYINVLQKHKVIMDVGGHAHGVYVDCTSRCKNSEGTYILFKSLCPLILATDPGASFASRCIIYVNDQTGEWFISGGDLERGNRVLRFTANHAANRNNPAAYQNYDVYNANGNWVPNDTMATDKIIEFNNDYLEADPGTFIEDGPMGSYTTQLIVAENWTRPLGGESASSYGLLFTYLDHLVIEGGFASGDKSSNDLTWINARHGIGKVEVVGHGGNGGKHILIDNSFNPHSDKYWHDVRVNTGDDTYTVEFKDSASEMGMKRLSIVSGIVDIDDVRGVDSEDSVINSIIYGGTLRLSRSDADVAISAGDITMYGGTLDCTTGSNSANGKIIDTIRLRPGANVNFDLEATTITNGIKVTR